MKKKQAICGYIIGAGTVVGFDRANCAKIGSMMFAPGKLVPLIASARVAAFTSANCTNACE